MILRVSCLLVFFCVKQKTAYEMRISDWSSDVCSSDLSPTLSHPHPLRQCCHPWNRARASNLRRTGEDRGTWWCPRLLPNRRVPAPPTDARNHESLKGPDRSPDQWVWW